MDLAFHRSIHSSPQLSTPRSTVLRRVVPIPCWQRGVSGRDCGRICVLPVVNSGAACGRLVHSLWSCWGELQVRAGDGCCVDNSAVAGLFCRTDEAKPTGSAEKFGPPKRPQLPQHHRNVFDQFRFALGAGVG